MSQKYSLELMKMILYQPLKIFWICLSFAGVSLLFNGGFINLYRLHRNEETLFAQIKSTRLQVVELDKQLSMAKDPVFIQRQALDRYDMVDENDLVFVFPEE